MIIYYIIMIITTGRFPGYKDTRNGSKKKNSPIYLL